ncbi:Bodo-specific multi-copy gene family, putative, partial [Bodo saltans]
ARAQYPVQSQWFPQAYTCFLVSSTKAKVDGSDIIPVNPAWRHGSRDPHRTLTFNEAAMCSMGLFDPSTSRFLVPPITFSDVVAAREDVPILPSQLHPLLDADVVARYDKCTSKERDRKPPQLMEIDVESCLKPHLVEIVLPQPIEAVMRSQKRNITFGPMPHLATVSRRRKKDYMFDLSMLDRAMSPKLGSDQRNIARYHCKGNGMLLIREFLSSKRLTAAKKGRVIVSSCKSPWVTRLLSGAVDSADVAMCELIRTHVESITGLPQDPSKYCDPSSAFATWMSETAWFFRIAEGIGNVDPLIILQSCERLNKVDQNHLMHKTSRRPSTLLEAFCLALPSPHSMLLIGHNMQLETTDPTFANLVNMTSFP